MTKISGSLELENSFSVQVTSGVGLGFLGQSVSASTTVTTGNTQKITVSQDTEVKVRPGKIVSFLDVERPEDESTLTVIYIQGAVVANISYTTQPGQMKVDTRYAPFSGSFERLPTSNRRPSVGYYRSHPSSPTSCSGCRQSIPTAAPSSKP